MPKQFERRLEECWPVPAAAQENIEAYLRRLHRFIGYGSPKAELVFMGIEEGGENVSGDAGRPEFVDLADYYLGSFDTILAKIRTPVWWKQAAFALVLLKRASLSDRRTMPAIVMSS